MNPRETILEILARARDAAAPAAGPERTLAEGGHAARRDAILAEIDETMLARALSFRIGAARLTIEARGRRALRATGLDPAEGAAGALYAQLEAGGLEPDAECRLLAGLIHDFAATRGPLSVVSDPSELPPSVVEKGHAAADLATASPVLEEGAPETADEAAPVDAREGPDGKGVLQDFHARSAGFAGASALVDEDGKIAAEHGGADAADLARDLCFGGARPLPFLGAALPGAHLVLLGAAPDADLLCLAADAERALVAEIASAELGTAVEAWRSAGG